MGVIANSVKDLTTDLTNVTFNIGFKRSNTLPKLSKPSIFEQLS